MATLQKIRNRAGLLVAIVIGMALLAFVLGDMLNSGSALMRGSQFNVAEIGGEPVTIQEYQQEIDNLIEITKFTSGRSSLDEATYENIKEEVWKKTVREHVLNEELNSLGVDVSSDELWEMIQGQNMHPIIRQLFTNPETGRVNTAAIINFLKTYDQDPTGQQKAYWLFLENEIVEDRKFNKYINLISKGLYYNDIEAAYETEATSKNIDIQYIVQRFNTIPDSAVEISNSDIKKYYEENKINYEQSASRDIEYITFDVVASEADRVAAKKWLEDIKADFQDATDNGNFVNLNSDESFKNINQTKDDLSDELVDEFYNAEPGKIYGPYKEGNSYKLTKLSEVNYLPDSVKARHILLQPNQQYPDYPSLQKLADSVVSLINSGRKFEEMVEEFSADNTSVPDGGNLGWFREGDYRFADSCFYYEKNMAVQYTANYGIHLFEVTDKSKDVKKLKLATITRNIEPSTETYQNVYAQASKFAGNNHTYEDFIKAIEKENLTKRVANYIAEGAKQIAGLENPREFIRSAYAVGEKEIITSDNNPIFELGNKFVIGFVKTVREEGFAPLDQVRSQIVVELKKQKKALKIATELESQLKQSNNLENLADNFNLDIFEATGINFRSFTLPNAGSEPKVIAAATALGINDLSEPVIGENGVYVIRVTNITESEMSVEMQKQIAKMQLANRAAMEAYDALKESYEIEDNRAKFY